MRTSTDPKFIMQYLIHEEMLSERSRRMRFHSDSGQGEMTLLELYPGVQVWTSDFCMKSLDIRPEKSYHYLKLNYCLSGGCEVPLPDDRYVYINEGRLSVDINPPMGHMVLPSRKYAGLEVVIDLQKIRSAPPQAWVECGIDIYAGAEALSGSRGSYLAFMTPEWDSLARKLAEHINKGNLSVEDCRFLLLQLLWMLKTGEQDGIVFEQAFLTRGQRAAAMRAEELLIRDLRRRYGVEKLALEVGVSSASLKKYFTQAYGKPISIYLREARMERAKELLSGTALSIADVASEVGYENQGKFGAMFRREVGVTPLEYRRIHRSKLDGKEDREDEIVGSEKR